MSGLLLEAVSRAIQMFRSRGHFHRGLGESKKTQKEDGKRRQEEGFVCLCGLELVSIPGRKQVETILEKSFKGQQI